MKNNFTLDNRLANDSFQVIDLNLCRVLLMNNALYPWLILVPMQNNLREIIDLDASEQIILMNEIALISKIMQQEFIPHKLNVATLGNVVEQLHIHIIARYKDDACFPQPVFGKESKSYDDIQREKMITTLRDIIKANS